MVFCLREENFCGVKKETAQAVSFYLQEKPPQLPRAGDSVPDVPFLSPVCAAINTQSRL